MLGAGVLHDGVGGPGPRRQAHRRDKPRTEDGRPPHFIHQPNAQQHKQQQAQQKQTKQVAQEIYS